MTPAPGQRVTSNVLGVGRLPPGREAPVGQSGVGLEADGQLVIGADDDGRGRVPTVRP